MMEWEMEGKGGYGPMVSWLDIVVVAVLAGLGVFLNAVILRKAGHSQFWAILFLFPALYLIGLWVFAFVRWPAEDHAPPVEPEGAAGEGGIAGRSEGARPWGGPTPYDRRSFSNRRRW